MINVKKFIVVIIFLFYIGKSVFEFFERFLSPLAFTCFAAHCIELSYLYIEMHLQLIYICV